MRKVDVEDELYSNCNDCMKGYDIKLKTLWFMYTKRHCTRINPLTHVKIDQWDSSRAPFRAIYCDAVPAVRQSNIYFT